MCKLTKIVVQKAVKLLVLYVRLFLALSQEVILCYDKIKKMHNTLGSDSSYCGDGVSAATAVAARQRTGFHSVLGAALEDFPCKSEKTSFGSTYAAKIEAKKMPRSTFRATPKKFVPPPKSVISTLPKYRPLNPCNIIIAALLGRARGFWQRSRTGCPLARATALPKTRACHSRRR